MYAQDSIVIRSPRSYYPKQTFLKRKSSSECHILLSYKVLHPFFLYISQVFHYNKARVVVNISFQIRRVDKYYRLNILKMILQRLFKILILRRNVKKSYKGLDRKWAKNTLNLRKSAHVF